MANSAMAQQGILFKIKYQPSHTYQNTFHVEVKPVVTVTGSQEILEKLSAMGIGQPVNADLTLDISGQTKSGYAASDGSFPIVFNYMVDSINAKVNGKNFPSPPNKTNSKKVYAHINPDGQLKIDSANGKKMNDSTEKKMRQMMDMVQHQIKFPDKPLKPGDTFTQGMPFTIPMKGMGDSKIDISVTYKLISIAGDKAYFDMVENININAQIKKATTSITGTGTGKMVYSVKDNFPISSSSVLNMKISAAMGTTTINGTTAVNVSQATTIN